MQRKTRFFLLILVFAAFIMAVLVLNSPKPQSKPKAELPVPSVDVVVLTNQAEPVVVEAQGTVQPSRKIDVVARVSGVVISVNPSFDNGGIFAAGEELISLEDADYRYALIRQEASLMNAKKNLAMEKGQALQAKRQWRDLGDKEANSLFLREPQLAAAQAQERSAQADVDKAKLDLERTHIKAPFNAIIAQSFVELGQFVSPGQKIAHIFSTDAVEVRLPLTDRQVRLIDLPMLGATANELEVTLEGIFGGVLHQWTGKLTRVEASLNIDSQTIYAVVEVTDPYSISSDSKKILPIGLFVNAKIKGDILAGSYKLPRAVLKPGNVIYVIRDNRLALLEVEVLQSTATFVLINADLTPNEQVVLSEMPYAVPGMEIKARNLPELLTPEPVESIEEFTESVSDEGVVTIDIVAPQEQSDSVEESGESTQ